MVDLLDVSLSDLGASAPPASDPWGLPPPTSAKIQVCNLIVIALIITQP